MNHKQIRAKLTLLGINEAVAENIMCGNVPCVLLRWYGHEAIISGNDFTDYRNDDTLGNDELLASRWSDEVLK